MKRSVVIFSLICLVACAAQVRAQGTWAERLGYPAGKRVVILHADNMGGAYEFNRMGQQLLEDGVVQSAATLVPGPWFAEFAAWRKDHPSYDIGISLSFVAPSPAVRWGPIAARDKVPTLVTPDGFFAPTVLQFRLRADARQVRLEAERQIAQARQLGLNPTHLLPHLGSMFQRPDLLKVYLELAQQYWIPAVMVELTPALIARLRRDGHPVDPESLAMVAAYKLPKIDNVVTVADADTYEEKRANLYKVIEDLPPGITQIFLAPAENSAALRHLTPHWQNRIWEARLLRDPEVHKFVRAQNLIATNWREIMDRFQAGEDVRSEIETAPAKGK